MISGRVCEVGGCRARVRRTGVSPGACYEAVYVSESAQFLCDDGSYCLVALCYTPECVPVMHSSYEPVIEGTRVTGVTVTAPP